MTADIFVQKLYTFCARVGDLLPRRRFGHLCISLPRRVYILMQCIHKTPEFSRHDDYLYRMKNSARKRAAKAVVGSSVLCSRFLFSRTTLFYELLRWIAAAPRTRLSFRKQNKSSPRTSALFFIDFMPRETESDLSTERWDWNNIYKCDARIGA